METFNEQVEKWIKANESWLGDEHALALAMLQQSANELDQEFKAAIASVYMQAARMLAKQAPNSAGEVSSELDALLADE